MRGKYFLVALVLILAILLVGCGGGITTPHITPNQSLITSFTANPTSGITSLEVAFDAPNSSDSDVIITSYAWDFKDEYIGTRQTINHTFSSSGSYSVILIVTDDKRALFLQAWS